MVKDVALELSRKQIIQDVLVVAKALGFIWVRYYWKHCICSWISSFPLFGGPQKITLLFWTRPFDYMWPNEIWVRVTCYFWAKAVKMSCWILQPVSSAPAWTTKKGVYSNWLSNNKVETLWAWVPRCPMGMLCELDPLGGFTTGMDFISII